jgi:hypothetical protein
VLTIVLVGAPMAMLELASSYGLRRLSGYIVSFGVLESLQRYGSPLCVLLRLESPRAGLLPAAFASVFVVAGLELLGLSSRRYGRYLWPMS